MCAIGSAVGPIIVMIDASRLSHSLATALKDRPHGIPVQPNRSLPLRPPPPLPVRISSTKSPKNSQLTQSGTQEIKNGRNCSERLSVDQNGCTKEGDLGTDDDQPSLGVVGMNFYDSQEKEDDSRKMIVDQSCKSRHSKSLDHKESDESSCGDNRRKSFESGMISHGERNTERNSFNLDLASPEAKSPKQKKRRGSYAKKRKSSSTENNFEESRTDKSPKIQRTDSPGTPKSKSKNFDKVESSGFGLPTIIRSRNVKYPRIETEEKKISSGGSETTGNGYWRQTSSNSYKLIRPKPPAGIPKCPVAIPIAVANALNMNDAPSSQIDTEASGPDTNQRDTIKPKIKIAQNETRNPKPVEDLENTLPSMPSLDLDLQNGILKGKIGENAARQPVTIADAQLLRTMDDLSSKMNNSAVGPIRGDVDSTHDHKLDQPYSGDSVVNQAMLQIHVVRCSPDLIILTSSPQLMSNGNVSVMPDNSSIKATAPEKSVPMIQSAGVEEVENNKQTKNLESLSTDQKQHMLQSKDAPEYEAGSVDTFRISQSQELEEKSGGDESIVNKSEEIRKESQARSKVDLEKLKCRKNRFYAKLEELYKEETQLISKMEQTNDPSRLTRLQQKLNCAKKKIENTVKYLNKVISIEKPVTSVIPTQLRIQVRQDLVETNSTETVEPVRRSPFVPCVEQEHESSPVRSPPVSSPLVITISESDSASSDDESYTIDEPLSDNFESVIKPNPDLKMELKYDSTMDVKCNSSPALKDDNPVDSTPNPLIPAEVAAAEPIPLIKKPEIMNNNVEYTDKNLSSKDDRVPAGGNEASTRLPALIPDPINYSAKDLGRVAEQKSPNTEYRASNLNIAPERFDKDQRKPNCNCSTCLWGNPALPVQNKDNSYIPTPVVNVTANQKNMNTQPVTNYPGHQDYRATGNVTSMFSRENGGANINLSSPLQGHSALPLPPSSQRNLTAQGYPMPGEHSPNYQSTQWHNQLPGTKLPVPFTSDQDGSPHPSILAAHLLKTQSQESANFARPPKVQSFMTEQFPTLGNWAAQITREPTTRKPVNNTTAPQINPLPVIEHPTVLKTTGSDMYKMTASAVDARPPAAGPANGLHRTQARTWPEQQRVPSRYPGPRSNPPVYPRNFQPNPQNTQTCYIAQPGHQGSPVYVPYPTHSYLQTTPSVPQSIRSMEYPNVSQNKQTQYYSPAVSTQPAVSVSYQNQGQVNSGHTVHSLAMMQNKYIQQPLYAARATYSQWMTANNYSKQQYLSSQYNGYNLQAKPTDNSIRYTTARPPNKNSQPLNPVREVNQRREQSMQKQHSNVKMPRDIYNNRAILPNRVIPKGLNEPLDLGRSRAIPQSVMTQILPARLNNLKCSLCGTNGPKFNCIDCEAAFYCNESCQAQHWRTHVLECSQRMPKLKKVS